MSPELETRHPKVRIPLAGEMSRPARDVSVYWIYTVRKISDISEKAALNYVVGTPCSDGAGDRPAEEL